MLLILKLTKGTKELRGKGKGLRNILPKPHRHWPGGDNAAEIGIRNQNVNTVRTTALRIFTPRNKSVPQERENLLSTTIHRLGCNDFLVS